MSQTVSQTTQTTAPGTVTFQQTLSMTVTDLARVKLQEFLGSRSMESVGVRISVQAGGCSGASYGMEFAEKAEPGELKLNSNGVTLYLQPEHAPLLNGVQIDYVDELMGGGFKIANPNAKSSCGCGKSFSA
ncbi:MAG: iron-sulfur cluster assembly accessory protein [bacterium]